jgi:hypothetical protein
MWSGPCVRVRMGARSPVIMTITSFVAACLNELKQDAQRQRYDKQPINQQEPRLDPLKKPARSSQPCSRWSRAAPSVD